MNGGATRTAETKKSEGQLSALYYQLTPKSITKLVRKGFLDLKSKETEPSAIHSPSRLLDSCSLPITAVDQISQSLAKSILHGVVLLGLLWMFPFLSTLFCKLKLRTWCCCCCSWCCWFSLSNTRCGHYRKFLSANLFFIPLAHEAQLMALSKVNTKKCKFFFQ